MTRNMSQTKPPKSPSKALTSGAWDCITIKIYCSLSLVLFQVYNMNKRSLEEKGLKLISLKHIQVITYS